MPAVRSRLFGLALALATATCVVQEPDYTGRLCDETHPCPSGLACADGTCTQAGSGIDAGIDAGDDGGVDGGHDAGSCIPFTPTPCAAPSCMSTFIGDAAGTPRQLNHVISVPDAGVLIAVDQYHHQLLELTLDGGTRVIAGNGICGGVSTQSLCFPSSVTRAHDGTLYIADVGNNAIRALKNGQLSLTFDNKRAGGFSAPLDIAWANGRLFIANLARLTVFELASGNFFHISDWSGTRGNIHAVTVSPNLNTVYFSHEFSIRASPTNVAADAGFSPDAGQPPIIAGQMKSAANGFLLGNLSVAKFGRIAGLSAGSDGIYLADSTYQRVLRVNLGTQQLEAVAGTGQFGSTVSGPALNTPLAIPTKVFAQGDSVYVLPKAEDRLLRYSRASQTVENVLGSTLPLPQGCADKAEIGYVAAFTESPVTGTLYFTDTLLHAVMQYTPDGRVTPLTGNGPGYDFGTLDKARFFGPSGIVWVPSPTARPLGQLIVADSGNGLLRRIDLDLGTVDTLTGTPHAGPVSGSCFATPGPALTAKLCGPGPMVRDAATGRIYFADGPAQRILYYEPGTDRVVDFANAFSPRSLALRPQGGLWVAQSTGLLELDGAGTSVGDTSRYLMCSTSPYPYFACFPTGLATRNNELFYSAGESRTLRRWNGGNHQNVAGVPWRPGYQDGSLSSALFAMPGAIFPTDGGFFVTDNENHRIRFVSQ